MFRSEHSHPATGSPFPYGDDMGVNISSQNSDCNSPNVLKWVGRLVPVVAVSGSDCIWVRNPKRSTSSRACEGSP